jgi:hypothetical protein
VDTQLTNAMVRAEKASDFQPIFMIAKSSGVSLKEGARVLDAASRIGRVPSSVRSLGCARELFGATLGLGKGFGRMKNHPSAAKAGLICSPGGTERCVPPQECLWPD